MRPLSVVLCDRPEALGDQKKSFIKVFKKIGYEALVEVFGRADDLVDRLVKRDVHVAIVDLSLGDKENWYGLATIQSIKIEYPDVLVIANSSGDPGLRKIDAKHPNFDLFVDKNRIDDPRYLNFITDHFNHCFRRNTSITLGTLPSVSLVPDADFKSILEQVTFLGQKDDEFTRIAGVDLDEMLTGKSGSAVYRMEAYTSNGGQKCIPAVIKISRIDKAQREIDNYHAYVKWALPYTWRSDILGTGFTKAYGGVCYSFILSDEKSIAALTAYLKEEKDHMIKTAIEKLFSIDTQRWYSSQWRKTETDLVNWYKDRYFKDMDQAYVHCARPFVDIVENEFHGKVRPNGVMIGGVTYPIPADTLLPGRDMPFTSCICHGDLNADNIIVAENGELIFIDFQETGRGHAFIDFVILEVNIRLYYPANGLTPEEFLQLENDLVTGIGGGAKTGGYQHIAQIRYLAVQNFPEEDFRNYYYSVAMYSYRLLREDINVKGKTRLLAALLVSLEAWQSMQMTTS